MDDFDTQMKIMNIIRRDIKMQEKADDEKRKILLFRHYKWLQTLYIIIIAKMLHEELDVNF